MQFKAVFNCQVTLYVSGVFRTHHQKYTTLDHNKSRIYKLICKTCNKAYVGQTSTSLNLRFHEHIRYIKNNDPQSAYAQHILQNIHEFGTLEDTMVLLKPIHNKAKLIPYEQLYIQTLSHHRNLTDEQSNSDPNPLFQLLIDSKRTSPTD
jgi:hypothetical protein